MKAILLAAVLHVVAPFLSDLSVRHYANVIVRESRRRHVDPFLVAAVIQHESHWHASADNGRCVGLGQVCLETQAACKDGLDVPACQARRLELLDGPTNIHVMVGQLAAARDYCGPHASLRDIVSSYAGTGACGQNGGRRHPIVTAILKIRNTMRKDDRYVYGQR